MLDMPSDYIFKSSKNNGTGGEGLTPSQLEKLNSIDGVKTELFANMY